MKNVKKVMLLAAVTLSIQASAAAEPLNPSDFYYETLRIGTEYSVEGIPNIAMIIGEKEVLMGNERIIIDTAPKIIGERTYIPVRAVAELFKAETDYDDADKTITVNTESLCAKFRVGGDKLEIVFNDNKFDSYTVELSAMPVIDENDRCLLPVRNVAEDIFGCEVEWDGEKQTVVIDRAYQLRRLLVKLSGDYDFSALELSEHIYNEGNLHILQFDLKTPETIVKKICDRLNGDERVKYAEPDKIIQVGL